MLNGIAWNEDAEVGLLPFRPSLTPAVVAVLAMATACGQPQETTTAEPVKETAPGAELRLMSPLGSVEQIRKFAWESPLRADRYR
jgi:hypothetical protein